MPEDPARILIVDDEPALRRWVARLFAGSERWVVCGEAEDGYDASRRALELSPDLVILDLRMPRMDGIEAAAAIRRNLPATRIILFTSDESPQSIKAAQSAGVDRYVHKGTQSAVELLEAAAALLFRCDS